MEIAIARQQNHPLRARSAQDREGLLAISRSYNAPAVPVVRATALLAVADGYSFSEAARRAGRRSGDAVGQLVSRFNRDGLAALETRHGDGRQARYSDAARQRILVRCLHCTARFPMALISFEVLPPRCLQCSGVLKNDTMAFGEPIPGDVLEQCWRVVERCDCMIVAGTSATVTPAAYFPMQVRERGGTLIEVNLYESEMTPFCTVSLRGQSGEILHRLAQTLQTLHTARP